MELVPGMGPAMLDMGGLGNTGLSHVQLGVFAPHYHFKVALSRT